MKMCYILSEHWQYKEGKFSKEDIEFFHEAWKEIEDTEAYKGYGIGYYKFAF